MTSERFGFEETWEGHFLQAVVDSDTVVRLELLDIEIARNDRHQPVVVPIVQQIGDGRGDCSELECLFWFQPEVVYGQNVGGHDLVESLAVEMTEPVKVLGLDHVDSGNVTVYSVHVS